MRIIYKLIIGFLAIAVLVAAVGYISVTTNRYIRHTASQLRRSSLIEMKCATEMISALKNCHSNLQELLAINPEDRNDPGIKARDMAEIRQDIQTDLENFQLYIIKSRYATELGLQNAQEQKAQQFINREKKELDVWYSSVQDTFLNYRYSINKLFALIGSTSNVNGVGTKRDMNKAIEFFDRRVDALYRQTLLPQLEEYNERTQGELLEGILMIDKQALRANRTIASWAFVLVIIAILIGGYIAGSISKPISTLRDAAIRIGQGDFGYPIHIKSGGEIKQLAHSLRKMASDLQKAQQHLEERIRERTVELQQSNKKLRLEIIDRRHMEKALRKSEAQLSNALTIANMGHWEFDVAKDEFVFNDHFYAMLRTTAGEQGGYTMSSSDYAKRFVHPDDLHLVGAEIQKAIETTDPNFNRKLEHRILYADGKTGYITVRFLVVKDENGRTIKTYGVSQDITERKIAEEAIKQSEQDYRGLFDGAHDAIIIFKPENEVVLDVNRSACEMYGFDRSEFIGMSMEEISKNVPQGKKQIRKTVKTGLFHSFESVQYTKDGSEMHMDINASLVNFRGQQAIQSINRDITDWKAAQEQIQWLARFPEENPAPVVRISKAGEILYANKSSSPLLKKWCSKLNETLPKSWRQLNAEVFRSGENRNVEVSCDNQIFSLSLSPMQDENYVNVYGVDITERKMAEEALAESEEKYRTLFENAIIGIYRTTPDGKIVIANSAMLKMLGYSSFDEISNLNVQDDGYTESNSQAKFKELIKRENLVKDFEAMWKKRDGSEIFIRENARVFRDSDGNVLYYEGTVENITEQKLAEKELRLQGAALNSAANAIMITNREGIIQWVNPALCQLTGYATNELIGKTPNILKSGIYGKVYYRKLWTSILNGEKWQAEIVNKCKNGKLITIDQRIAPVLDEKGEVSHFIAIQQDITQRKLMEDALRESEELYRTLAEAAPVSIYIINKKKKVEYVNKFGAQQVLTKPSQIIGKKVAQVFPKPIAKKQISILNSIFKSGKPYNGIDKIVFPGVFMWIDSQVIPLRLPNGEIYAVLGISHNITEVKKTGDALRQYTARLEALQEIYRGILASKSSEEIAHATLSQLRKIVSKFQRSAVVLFDSNSNEATILAHNAKWESNVTKREHLPLSHFQHVYDLADKPYVLVRDLKEQKSKAPVEDQLFKEGVRSYFSLPLKINDRLFGSFNIGSNTPDAFSEQEIEIACEVGEQLAVAINQAQLKEQIQQHASEIQASLHEKEMLLKEIHHRVKNNMQVISSLLNLQSGKIQDQSSLEIFRDSENRIKSMALIHEKLYRSDSLSKINFADYVADLTNGLFSSYNSRNVGLTLDVDNIYLGVDTAIPCGLIINELVSNAFKYAFPKNKAGEITIKLFNRDAVEGNNANSKTSNCEECQYVLIVRDNGIGIPDEVDLRHTKSLGLKLVHSLVQQLKGTVDYYNSKGAEFKIQFQEIDKSSIKKKKGDHANEPGQA